MSDQSSGIYVIDADYNIVSFNQTCGELYPQLVRGRKCYRCLMGLDEPCPPCPVANKIRGPQTYLDPLRGIYETVDAVDMVLENGAPGHALVMSTVGESAAISARLPRTRDELNRLLEQEYFDKLTEGYSRKGFIRQTETLFGRVRKTDYAVVVFDIRNFKAINDIFGIEGGDQVLKYVFSQLQSSWLHPVVSARIESDWFLFLVNRSRLEEGSLDALLNLEWTHDTRVVPLHLRCGIYYVEDTTSDVSNMVEWAILAREFARRESYGGIAVFNANMRRSYVDHAKILSAFTGSVKNGDFQVYYQPIVRARDGRPCGAEALVRWNHPELGFLSPAVFIPVLEKGGMISRLDRTVLSHVFDVQEAQKSRGRFRVPISVNLSRLDFYDDQLISDIFRLAQQHPSTAGSVNFEVTETSVSVLQKNCSYLLEQLRQGGAKILLDDFGSGFSSLSMIGDYSFDVIKIDKAFIDQVEAKETVRAIITSTIDMCHEIGLQVVAEGVENEAQLAFLRECHCDYIQGYYFAKPMPEEAFLAYLEEAGNLPDTAPETSPAPRPEVTLEDLLDLTDHDDQFIQVCCPEDYTMVFANEKTLAISGHPERPYEGEKCYQYMLGLDAPCGHCPMKKMGTATEKSIEVDDGAHVFSLKARFTNWNGRRVFIEYGRDVTDTRIARDRYARQIQSIIENIPEGQGVFHMDLTADRWLSSRGIAQYARNIQNVRDVDTLIHRIASFVPDAAGQQEFEKIFSRAAQLASHAKGQHQIVHETRSYYDDHSIRWSRITAQMIDNPNNGHIESILYGVDISRERARVEELERERVKTLQEKEALQKEVTVAWGLYSQADRDRRYDCLTGLGSRLDLLDKIRISGKPGAEPVTAVLLLDLDDFKHINDTYGHPAGDQCLRAIGRAIREFGEEEHITFYRFGGEEVVGITGEQDFDGPRTAAGLLARVRETKIALPGQGSISLTASLGYTTKVCDCQQMIQTADQAMYAAKRRGKDQSACLD